MKKLSLFLILAFSGIGAAKKASKENRGVKDSIKTQKLIQMVKKGQVVLTSQCGTVTPLTTSESQKNWRMVGSYSNKSKKSAQKGLLGERDNCTIYGRNLSNIEQGLTGGDSHNIEPVVVVDGNGGVVRSTTQASGNLVKDTGQVAAGAVEGTAEVAGNTVEGFGQALDNLF